MNIKSIVDADGFAFLPRHLLETDILSAVMNLGEPASSYNGIFVQTLAPSTTPTPTTYSGIFGLQPFPFHSDLAHWDQPPHYVLLRCLRGFHDVPTLLIDGRPIVDILTIDFLSRAIVRPRRPQSGELRLMRIWQTQEQEDGLFRWDGVFLKPASRLGGLAFDAINHQIKRAAIMSAALVDFGDTLIIDNWRMLHSRPQVPIKFSDRLLERVYLRSLN